MSSQQELGGEGESGGGKRGRGGMDLVVCQVLPSLNVGGVERGVVEVANHLADEGMRNIVACSGGAMAAQLRSDVTLVVSPILASKNPVNVLFFTPLLLLRVVHEHGVTILHARSRHSAWSAWIVRLLSGVKVVCTHHGAYGLERGLVKRVVARPMLWGDLAIMPSEFIMRHVMAHQRVTKGGIPGRFARLLVIPRGVDCSVFEWTGGAAARAQALAAQWGLRPDTRYILLPGRISRIKGQLQLLSALAAPVSTPPPINALLVGREGTGGRYGGKVEAGAELARGCCGGDVRVLDRLDDMPAVLLLGAVVVAPSLVPEAFCRVVVEALALGRPVVASSGGGVSEIHAALLAEGGERFASRLLLAAPGDVRGLREAIDTAIANSLGDECWVGNLSSAPRAPTGVAQEVAAFVRRKWDIHHMCEEEVRAYQSLIT